MTVPTVIAIDGPVASGKSTVGRVLATRLGYRFLDTGLMYRAVTLMALQRNIALNDAALLGDLAATLRIDVASSGVAGAERILADGEDVTDHLRSPQVETAVSLVSKAGLVRRAMVAEQQRIAGEGGIVMVGRDIGTKVLPHAAKVFLDASKDERALRRYTEAKARGDATTLEAVRANLELRDRLDSEREESPLRVADDAARLDTEGLDVEGVVDRILQVLGRG
ncbi:MAG: (d)CMP kinase [Dehalococcoidia bacterium]